MKKIISILLALGVVLSLTVMATPVAADVTEPQVDVDPDCACQEASYNITFNITASLTEGVGCVCVEFPEGTTVPATFDTGDIVINGEDVFEEEITVDGNVVCFIPPADVDDPGPVWVYFDDDVGLKNPCVPGEYTLFVWTCRAPDSTPVESAEYTIRPQYSTYEFVVDFGPTYDGIKLDFIPPFKACGQNMTTTSYCSTVEGYLEPFVLNFTVDELGCDVPCTNATLWAEIISIPDDETMSVVIEGNLLQFTADNVTEEVGEMGDEDLELFPDLDLAKFEAGTLGFGWAGAGWYAWNISIHFSSPGTYEFCLYAECPAVTGCDPEASEMIAERCLEAVVHQWKDAAKITIDEKWNLLSLPLVPFDSDIEHMLASLPEEAMDDLISIWHYDRCSDTWFVYDGNEYEELTDIDHGKSYWFRMDYPITGNYSWWVWGTEMPEPEDSPAEYAVCEGWNMVGFTSLTDYPAEDYLWNWTSPVPVVYGWTQGDWNSQGWNLIDVAGSEDLISGQGYWMAFPADGAIYVPTP